MKHQRAPRLSSRHSGLVASLRARASLGVRATVDQWKAVPS
jgi:hypothetical protein